MAIRILPFRDYDEHDVVNIYRMDGVKGDFIDLSESTKQSTANGDAGVFVKVKNGILGGDDWDPVDVDSNAASLLGKTDYPHVGRNNYPQATLTVEPVSASGDACIGITLRQTVEKDENGENLLYNPIKKDELFGVLPGEAVPVLSKGLVSITDAAVNGSLAVGQSLITSTGGKVSGVAYGSVNDSIGLVIGSGARADAIHGTGTPGATNVFGQYGYQSGSYFLVKLNCA